MRPLAFSGQLPFTIIFWIAVAVWILPEMFSSRRMQSGDRSRSTDRGSMFLVIGASFFGAWLAVWLAIHVDSAAIRQHRVGWFFTGVVLILAGVALRRYAMFTLGRSFTFDVAVREGQRVIEAGPYRYIRHPSYTGGLISTIGFGLMLGSWASLAAAPLCLFAAYIYRMHVEEAALLTALGDLYRSYIGRTRRLVPFLY
ncbi:MAG TPA: isoprenylcysteine carboxylmethyltransferase family protein [Acidisarcina sp.]